MYSVIIIFILSVFIKYFHFGMKLNKFTVILGIESSYKAVSQANV